MLCSLQPNSWFRVFSLSVYPSILITAGEGAYGKVYCGLNQTSGELMAVKVLELIGVSGSRQSEAQLSELRQVRGCVLAPVGWPGGLSW